MAVEFVLQGAGVSTKWLRKMLREVLRFTRTNRGFWGIRVVGDREMALLHSKTLGLRNTTDVLTFDMRDSPKGPLELDTVICVDEARRRAKEHGHTVRKELLLYCVHSLLHVRGYDDVTPEQAAVMHAREDEILVAIGVGAVYAARTAMGPRRRNRRALKRSREQAS